MKEIIRILLVVVIVSCLFTGVAAAKTIDGKVYDDLGREINRQPVIINTPSGGHVSGTTDDHGNYAVDVGSNPPEGTYQRDIGNNYHDEKNIRSDDWNKNGGQNCEWDRPPRTGIPEFPTVALPIAGVIGLVFLFQHRKN